MNIRTRFLVLATPFFLSTFPLHGQSAAPAPVQAPVWMMITSESSTMSVVLPAGTTYRFGDPANNRWSTPITVNAPTTFSPVYFPDGAFPFDDPDPGTVKELDVLETSSPQAITVTDSSVAPATTVSQIVPGLTAVPTSVPVTPGTAYTVTFSNFTIAQSAAPNTPMVAFVNAPPTLANQAWQGTQLNLTIDGVTLVCASGQGSTADAVTLSCTVPVPAASGQ
jgi:hypothetical protein